jgi:predicted Mrr-cat superfamily restriction endonuclease
VAIGWNELDDLTQYTNLETLKSAVRKNYSDYKDGTVNMNSGQIIRFKNHCILSKVLEFNFIAAFKILSPL